MGLRSDPSSRRARAKQEKQDRIMLAARELFAEHGVTGVTTQQIADRADVAIGTLFLYAATKAELLIMVQNEKFEAAIHRGLQESAAMPTGDMVGRVMALIGPVVVCVREQVENGRTYLHELVFGDPLEPYRRRGLELSATLETGLAGVLTAGQIPDSVAVTLARVITAIVHVSTTATIFMDRPVDDVVDDIRTQIAACVSDHRDAAPAAA